jgi:hypothetical protein
MKMRMLIFAAVFAALTMPAFAQNVTNLKTLTFDAPTNYNDLDGLGNPVVESCEYVATGMNANGAIVVTANIGKPTAANGGPASAPIPAIAQHSLNLWYTATLAAKGPGGLTSSGPSAPSNPFGFAAPTVPAKPTNVKAKP